MGLLSAMGRAFKNQNSTVIGKAGTALSVLTAPMTYDEAREEGHGKAYSFAKAAGETAFFAMAPLPLAIGAEVLMNAPGMAVDAYRWQDQYRRRLSGLQLQQPFQNASFWDTNETATMRQAGLAILQRAGGNIQQTRSAISNDARFYNK